MNPTTQNEAIRGREAAILAAIPTSYVMIVLDISVVITGLPRLAADLGFSDAGLSWVQSLYTLTFGGFLLLGARAGDILGRRRMLVTSLAIFTAASAGFMLAARAVAGVAASVGLVVGRRARGFRLLAGGLPRNWPIGLALIWSALRLIEEMPRQSGVLDLVGALANLVNVAHQIGSALGLGVLVALSMIGADGPAGADLVTHRAHTALLVGAAMLGLALALVLRLIVRRQPAVSIP